MYNNCNCNCHNQNNSSRANTTIISSEAGNDGLSAYQIAVNTGLFTGTEEEFVIWNRGDNPYIGPNGNWWIGNSDTGQTAEPYSPQSATDIFI